MPTTTSARVSARARRASDSQPAQVLARAGLAARGVIYVLIGWVAILVALGKTTQQADQRGALQLLSGKPYGLVSLWLLCIGFVAYALWRLSEAAFGVRVDGQGAGPRLKSLARAVVYGSLAVTTFSVISGAKRSQSGQQQDWTAKVMSHPGGRWAVGLAGVIVVVIGAVLVLQGVKRKFVKYLRTGEMSPGTRRVVVRLGVIGTVARGLVFALAGALVIDAAVTYQAAKAGGLDTALKTLRDQPFGVFALIVAAVGLIIFGMYGLCEARWRKV
jgi:type IV secretory pathway VirB2 component (pilin)